MQTKNITLPSGIVAEIIDGFTFGEFERIERAALASANITLNEDGTKSASFDQNAKIDHLAFLIAVKKLTAADGTDIALTEDAIANLSKKDGLALRDAVNAIDQDVKKE